MGARWDRFLEWTGDRPRPESTPPTFDRGTERAFRPLSFTLNAPPEFEAGGSLLDGFLEPPVGRRHALSVPAVKRARDLIAGTLGALPLCVHDPNRARVANNLIEQPEIDYARSVTMARTVEDLLFEERSWWRVTEFGWHGYPTKIRRLEPRSVSIRKNAKVYVSRDGWPEGTAWEWVPDDQLIRIDSPNEGLLSACAPAIRAALELNRTASRYARDPLPLGYFSPEQGAAEPENDDEVQDLLDDWEEARRKRTWGYLAGLKANALQWNPEQLQLSQARDYVVLEVSRATGIDPDDLAVAVATSRTYANSQQRRLDLIDFVLRPYAAAIEDRLSMGDVLPRGYCARFDFSDFLKADTLTRMQTYEIGRAVGAFDDERISEAEDIPIARVAAQAAKAAPAPAVPPPDPQEQPVRQPYTATEPAVTFTAEAPLQIGFMLADADAEFRVDAAKRTISGLAVPWNQVAMSGGHQWSFDPGSLHWADESRVKMDDNHAPGSEVGKAVRLQGTAKGLDSSFKVARGSAGDNILGLAEDGVYDGLSVAVDFAGQGDGFTEDPDTGVRHVYSATLRKVAITATPAFDDARVASVVASASPALEGNPAMTAPTPVAPAAPEPAPVPATAPDFAQFTAGLTGAIGEAVAAAFANLPFPQAQEGRQVIPAGRAVVTREAPVYSMNGQGFSMVRDAWKSRTEGDVDARDRLSKFSRQTADVAAEVASGMEFAASTSSASALIPPGYRPDLYVTQLMQGRPLVDAVSRGTLTDATPFTLPSFTSMSGVTADHVEGTNPSNGTITIDPVTVTPGAISGLFQLTREIADSSNPAIDAIAMAAMQESYSQQTEAKIYAELNGSNGQGGSITTGFVPSGAQASLVSGGDGIGGTGTADGADLLAGVRAALALYGFRRFAAPSRMLLNQKATSAFASAVGTDGRPLLPSVGAMNTVGVGNAVTGGWYVDGLTAQPTWSMTGSASTDSSVLILNSNDVWAWESGLLTFRFEERNGPALIDLALFGYFATRVIRPIGIASVRYSTAAI